MPTNLLFFVEDSCNFSTKRHRKLECVSNTQNGNVGNVFQRSIESSNSRSPLDSMRDAVFTVSPKRQYRGILIPTTPATQEPTAVRTREKGEKDTNPFVVEGQDSVKKTRIFFPSGSSLGCVSA